ncbi:DNA polymerase III subunit gamma/tau [Rheinheimera sp. MMS21-TC3]|uniref:DNA polymerase III subunit gamma/tau n=1 Tax=Rheinheimera sp. MMS21-TC3 TaxID=3072790 RepID=UPI0028C47E8B|nr:DNA polymerase III subunit gamma/tau [Rheinheimera sp. MMS21-TC3]WNO60011.1 DNA polymerase III subunit gamma/tau [Rheinheimera sp. MMS21-TC3]
MSYQVLARKWRPQHFSQLVGQEHVKNALSNALTNNRLHHAYLFTGTRGVGKTTIARIFAKSLNCEQGITASPCGTCSACLEIDAGNFVDLMEIDAASRTKVEDTRDLLDNVQYAPSRGRFKVYLIDEVHMLSKHSFNALLKTLEEPPSHVKFLLATTDPQKLPITVLSRCLQFNLLALSPNQISQHLAYVLTEEGIPFVEPALSLIAKAAKGSLRDSLSLTDQAIAQSNSNIQLDVIRAMLGYLEQSWAEQLLQAVLDQDAVSLQQQLASLVQQHNDYAQVLDDILAILHLTALSQFTPAAAAISESADFILQLAQRLEPAQVQLYYQLLISGKKELAYAPDALIGLEMALLRAMAFAPAKVNITSLATQPIIEPSPESLPQTAPAAIAVSPDIAKKTIVEPAVSAPEIQQPAAEQSISGIDSVTSGIMARRGIKLAQPSRDAEKKIERPKAPHSLELQQVEPPFKSQQLSHSSPVTTAEAINTNEVQPQPVLDDEPDSYVANDEPEMFEHAQADVMWQQFQTESPALTEFDGSINQQNFSIKFAAQVDAWAARIEQLDTGGLSRLFLLNAAMSLQAENMQLTVAKSQQHLDNAEFRQNLQQLLERSFNQRLQVHIHYQDEVADSPLAIQQRIVAERRIYVHNLLQQDPNIIQLQQLFGAQMLEDTIQVN